MSKQLTLVYQTDYNHTHASKVLIAICDDKALAIRTIEKYVYDQYKALLTERDEEQLNDMNQTQGDSEEADNPFEGEFMLEFVNTNTILI